MCNNGEEESHQLKRQRGSSNSWSLRSLVKAGVLGSAATQVGIDRSFFFVSLLPCRALNELADQARRSDNLRVFVDGLTKTQSPDFNYLCTQWGSPQDAFDILQHVDVRWPDERHIVDTNAALSELLIAGAPGPASAIVVGDLAWDNMGKTLDAGAIATLLSDYDLGRAQFVGVETTDAVARTYAVWQRPPWQPRSAASNGSHGRARNWATPQVGNGSAVGDHPYESSSDGVWFAAAGEPVLSEP
ncbi:MAG: hypothetical protein WBP81_26310 [Solirubrobacteraceae bacterium]